MTKVNPILQRYVDVQKKQKKRIIYDDELDGVPDYEPESQSDEEQEDNNKIEVKRKGKLQPKTYEKSKKVKIGITKSIKLYNFFSFIICN